MFARKTFFEMFQRIDMCIDGFFPYTIVSRRLIHIGHNVAPSIVTHFVQRCFCQHFRCFFTYCKPVGWSNYNESVQHDSHSFIENRKIPRLIISNIPNSHRLKMLGNACCPQQAAFAFAELWRRSTIEIPPPEMLSFPLPDIRQGKRKRTGSICKHCNGSGVL